MQVFSLESFPLYGQRKHQSFPQAFAQFSITPRTVASFGTRLTLPARIGLQSIASTHVRLHTRVFHSASPS